MINYTNRFKNNLPVKILALLASCMLWIFVMNEDNPSINTSFEVPIVAVNVPDDYDMKIAKKTVKVKVRAPRSTIAAMNNDSITATIDLSSAVEGDNSVRVKVTVPQGVKVLDVSDETILVTLDEMESKMVPIEIKLQGTPANNFVVNKVNQNHHMARVKGPRNVVDKITRLIGYVPVNGVKESFTIDVHVTPVTAAGNTPKEIESNIDTITVGIDIESGLKKKKVAVKPAVEGTVKEGYTMGQVHVDPTTIEIAGQADVVDKINSVPTVAFSVDGRDSSWRMDANVILPDGVTATRNKVTVSADVKPTGR